MDSRRVHRVGSKSLAVTLPSRWVKKVGLDVGGTVDFLDQEDLALVLLRADGARGNDNHFSMHVPGDATPRGLERMLIGAYVVGFNTIEFQGLEPFRPEQLDALRRAVSRLTGLAAVEGRPDRFVARCYLGPEWSALDGHLHQLVALTEDMVALAPAILGARDTGAAREALALGEQADRLYYLTIRFLITATADRGLRQRMGLDSPSEALGCRLVAKALEEIGDSMETVADIILHAEGKDLEIDADIAQKIETFSRRICGNLRGTVEAFFSASVERASDILEDVYQMEHEKQHFIEAVMGAVHSPLGATVLTAGGMALRDVCRFTRVMGEVALNNAIRRRGKQNAATSAVAVPATTTSSPS